MPTSRDNKPRWIALLVQAMVDICQGGSQRIYYRRRSFVVTEADLANGRFIRRIAADRKQAKATGKPPPRLVGFREEFRRIANPQKIGGLIECLNQTDDPEVLRLAIWLMARAHASTAIWAIAPFRHSTDVRVRYETARALRRLGAWAELGTMAHHDPNRRVRRLATAPLPKPFDIRFARFAGQVHTTMPPNAPRRPMRLIGEVPIGAGRAAKTPEFIRAILERIQRLVRGH